MHDVESAVEIIRARDASAATVAHALWQAMRMGAAHATKVTRYDVQRILWASLPLALRRPDAAAAFPNRHTARTALAELLDLVGYPRYAELCRSDVSREILDAAEDLDKCAGLVARAWRESGVEPPDTPILTWSAWGGPVEEALRGATGRVLEEAIDAGVIQLGRPDTDSQRIELTMRLLVSPDDDGDDTWFVRLLDERLDAWILGDGSQTRRELLVRLRPEVRHTPDVCEAGLPGLQRLLEDCRDTGVRLTERGYLPTTLVAELVERMPTCRELSRTGRSESTWPPVRMLRELADELDLVVLDQGRLRLTDKGNKLVDDSDSLLMCVGEGVVSLDRQGLAVIQEVILAALLLEDTVEPDRLFDKVTRVLGEEQWTAGDGEPFGHRHAAAVGGQFLRRLRVLDALVADWSVGRVGLTAAGRSMARWALRGRVLLREVAG